MKRKIFCLVDWNTAALPEVFFNRPFRLRPFCSLASLRVGRGGNPAFSLRLANPQNDSPFFIPYFFNSLLKDGGTQ